MIAKSDIHETKFPSKLNIVSETVPITINVAVLTSTGSRRSHEIALADVTYYINAVSGLPYPFIASVCITTT